MTLTPLAKRNIHAAIVGFASGALTYLAAALAGGTVPGVRALLTGIVMGGGSRLAGVILAAINTTEPTT
jgi:hypothetical protein